MSVQEGYTFLLKSLTWKLEHYRIYKKLLLHSFRIMRYSTLLRKQDKIKDKNVTKEQSALPVKRKIAEKDPLDHSKRQCHGLDNEKVCIQPRQEIIKQLFADMQKTAPKIFNGNLEVQNPDYCVFLPNNKSRVNYDLDLDICMDDLITKAIYSGDKPRLYGICTGDNIAYYKLINISLPHI